MKKEIYINNQKIISDYEGTKNVIKNIDKRTSIIYTPNYEVVRIRPESICSLITENAFNYNYKYFQRPIMNKRFELTGETRTFRKPTYARTTICEANKLEKVEKYNLSKDLPAIKRFISGKTSNLTITIHRLVKGLYDTNGVLEYKEKFKISDNDFHSKGLSKLEVDHVDFEKKDNYWDRLRVIYGEKNKQHQRHYYLNTYEYCYPLYFRDSPILFIHDLNEIVGDADHKNVLGVILDLNESGDNLVELKSQMLASMWNKDQEHMYKFLGKDCLSEQLNGRRMNNLALLNELLEKASEMEKQGLVKLELF